MLTSLKEDNPVLEVCHKDFLWKEAIDAILCEKNDRIFSDETMGNHRLFSGIQQLYIPADTKLRFDPLVPIEMVERKIKEANNNEKKLRDNTLKKLKKGRKVESSEDSQNIDASVYFAKEDNLDSNTNNESIGLVRGSKRRIDMNTPLERRLSHYA